MSGRQLFLIDSFRDTNRPLLSVLADPESVFIRALSGFKNRSLYSNIMNDRTAVYYTTCITATDPYADLSKININYLPGYSQVLVDAENPVSPIPTVPSSSTNSWFDSVDAKAFMLRARLGLFFTVFIPIGSFLYLINAAVQNVRSQQRIRLHASGKAGIIPHAYQIPLVMEAQRTAETVFEHMNSAHAQEYLEDNDDSESDEPGSGSADPLMRSTSTEKRSKAGTNGHTGHVAPKGRVGEMEFPTLALTAEQFAMIDSLDRVGFKKFPVHIHEVRHTHAAIIMRMQRESFREGKIVIGHWLENFEL
jgi:hypothetical protein